MSESDAQQALWAIDHYQDLAPANATDRCFYPKGLRFDYISWMAFPLRIAGLLARPLGVTLCYNLMIWLSLALACLGAFLLARQQSGCSRAAMVAGLAYGFCPYLAGRVLLGHFFYVVGAAVVPFFLLALLQFFDDEQPQLPWGAAVVLLWLMLLRTCVYYCIFLLPLGLLLTLWKRPCWRRLAALTLIGLITSALFVGPDGGHNPDIQFELPRDNVIGFDADVTSFLLPSPFHPLWGEQFARPPEQGIFLGWTLLLCGLGALVSFLREDQERAPGSLWVWGALLMGLVAVGPVLFVGGQRVATLPWAGLFSLPGASSVQVTARAALLVQLCLATAAAFFLAGRSRGKVVLAVALILMEFWLAPLATFDTRPSALHLEIARSADRTLIDIPLQYHRTDYIYYQTLHRRRLLFAAVLRPSDALLRLYQFLPWVESFTRADGASQLQGEHGGKLARVLDLGYIVLHKSLLSAEQLDAWRQVLIERFAVAETVEDERFLLLFIKQTRQKAEWPILLDLGEAEQFCFGFGWSRPERVDGTSFVWSQAPSARVWLEAGGAGAARLSVTFLNLEEIATTVELNGTPLGTLEPGESWHTASLEVPAGLCHEGLQELVFHFDRTVTRGVDPRRLAIAVDKIVLEPR